MAGNCNYGERLLTAVANSRHSEWHVGDSLQVRNVLPSLLRNVRYALWRYLFRLFSGTTNLHPDSGY